MMKFTTNDGVKGQWLGVMFLSCGEVLDGNSLLCTGPSVSSEMVSTQEEQAGHTRPPSRTWADHRDSKAHRLIYCSFYQLYMDKSLHFLLQKHPNPNQH